MIGEGTEKLTNLPKSHSQQVAEPEFKLILSNSEIHILTRCSALLPSVAFSENLLVVFPECLTKCPQLVLCNLIFQPQMVYIFFKLIKSP